MHIRYFVILLTSVLLFTGGMFANAQECRVTTVEKRYTVYFRVNESAIDPGYLDNAETMKRMVDEIGLALSKEGRVSCKIEIVASASPEGRYSHNEKLSKRRMDVVLSQIKERIDISQVVLHSNSQVEDWALVAEYVAADAQVPNRERVLEVLARNSGIFEGADSKQRANSGQSGNTAGSANIAGSANTAGSGNMVDLRAELQRIGGGAYEYILEKFFPLMRSARVVAVYDIVDRAAYGQLERVDVVFAQCKAASPVELQMVHPQTKAPKCGRECSGECSNDSRFGQWLKVKTNLVGWGMGHANVAVEWAFAEHFSFALPFYYSGGFDYFKETRKFRGIVLQPEVRYYFAGGKRRGSTSGNGSTGSGGNGSTGNGRSTSSGSTSGFYVGVHAGIGWYNYAIGKEFRIQDHKGERPAYGGGVAVGYSMPFKKNPRWGMEFSIGAGVYDAVYDSFYNEPNGAYAEYGKHTTWWGIDNASISFTYKFPFNKKEGRK